MQVKVKICGLTTPEAVDAAVKGGASHVGFVFSKEPVAGRISLEQAVELAARAPGHVRKVGVFFEQGGSIFVGTPIRPVGLHIVQLPVTDPREMSIRNIWGRSVWRLVPVRTVKDLHAITRWQGAPERIVYEFKPPEGAVPGGASEPRCDWELLRGGTHPCPWALGGRLDQTNVAEAIAITGARMIDVSSGVESSPGIKDPAKISALLDVVRTVKLERS